MQRPLLRHESELAAAASRGQITGSRADWASPRVGDLGQPRAARITCALDPSRATRATHGPRQATTVMKNYMANE